MKRVISLLLVIILVVGLFMLNTSALSSKKIDKKVVEKMNTLEENQTLLVTVEYELESTFEEFKAQVEKQVEEELGPFVCEYEPGTNEYANEKMLYDNKKNKYIYHRSNKWGEKERNEIIELLDIDIRRSDYNYTEISIIYGMTKEQILVAAELDNVTSINLTNSYIYETETELPIAPTNEETIHGEDDYVRNKLYDHYNIEGKLDWQLMEQYNPYISSPTLAYGVWGNRVFTTTSWEEPYLFSIGVYEPDTNKNRSLMSIYGEEKYADLEEVLNELNLGRLIGDVDEDNYISVIDSTYIQKALSGSKKFESKDKIQNEYGSEPQFGRIIYYISDFNEDGARDIIDATAIQKSIAKLG